MNQQTDLHDMFAHAAKGLGSPEVMGDPRALRAMRAKVQAIYSQAMMAGLDKLVQETGECLVEIDEALPD